MLLVGRITGDPDAFIRDVEVIFDSHWRLSPLEVKNVVCEVSPVLANIFSVVQLFVNAAGLILEFSAGCPRGSECPGALSWVEQELLDALSRVESFHISATVL